MSKIILQHCLSILDTVDTGFGEDNTLVVNPPTKPTTKIYLVKENYLEEFLTEEEKKIVRTNLRVYSKEEVDKKIAESVIDPVTKEDIQDIIEEYNYIQAIPYKN